MRGVYEDIAKLLLVRCGHHVDVSDKAWQEKATAAVEAVFCEEHERVSKEKAAAQAHLPDLPDFVKRTRRIADY
jgi:hypothetical protein